MGIAFPCISIAPASNLRREHLQKGFGMGLTRSYFATPYSLPTEEFLQLESQALNRSLIERWVKMPLFSERTEHFVPKTLTHLDAMVSYTDLIRHHVALDMSASALPPNNREIGKLYVEMHRKCLNLFQEELTNGLLLFREINSIQFPEVAIITQENAEKYANPTNYQEQFVANLLTQTAFKALELYQAHLSNMSIFGDNFDVKFRAAYMKEFQRPYLSVEEANRLLNIHDKKA